MNNVVLIGNISTDLELKQTIGVSGRLSVDSYEQDGQKKTFTKVVAHEIEFLGTKQQEKTIAEARYERKNATNANNFGITDEDFPF